MNDCEGGLMKWTDIQKKYPNKFILLGDIIEEKISNTRFKIIEGNVIEASDDDKKIRNTYRKYRKKGINVIYSLPSTSSDFIVENVPFKGIIVDEF